MAVPRAGSLAWLTYSLFVVSIQKMVGTETWSEVSGDHLAYHWLDAEGEVVEYDGQRTSFAQPVAPGERVRVRANLRGPKGGGRYRLQWELVREHERWYGPPVELGLARAWDPASLPLVRARWLAAALALALGLLTLAGPLARRRWPPKSARGQLIAEQLPLLWAGLAIWSLTLAFHDLSGIEAWRWSSALSASGVWIFVAGPALAGAATGRQEV